MPDSDLSAIAVDVEIAAKINFASHQCAFPVLESIRITNSSIDDRINDLVLKLTSNPPFIIEKQWSVDRIEPSSTMQIQHRDIKINAEFLRVLNEPLKGDVIFELTNKDDKCLAKTEKCVELLAYNEWGGATFMPELLAAFSMPNDPAIDKIIRSAAEILRQAGKKDHIDGYASNSRERVWEIASAIYTAVAHLGITYAAPPASFESNGQKLRLPSQIHETRVGTCLDTAMLLVSAFEQAGLNPLIALPKQHALAGVWLQPEKFSSINMEDAEILRKRIDLKELILIETTLLTASPPPKFSAALDSAMRCILPEYDDTFVAAIDICRARTHNITPLGAQPAPHSQDNTDNTATATVEQTFEEAPPLPDFDHKSIDANENVPQTPKGRLERWQRKLLNLTLHNRLLNHQSTKTSLELFCPNPSMLEDKLAEGDEIKISSMPKLIAEAQDQEIHQERTGQVIDTDHALKELEKGRILVRLPKDELHDRTTAIFRKTETSLQESGSNTLYLAIGFLLWKKSPTDERRFEAPLILLPVKLLRGSITSPIKIASHDDEPRFNTTLLEMLRRDFKIDISNLEGNLPTDNSGINVEKIWDTVKLAVKEVPGFEVIRKTVLGNFVFAKYLMWKDLTDRTEILRENLIVRHLLNPQSETRPTENSFVNSHDLDQKFEPLDLLTPLSTDASQMAAVAAADQGKNFIIIGPPGTGKSQTIANIIANALGKQKTILFVSEKTAALEAVYRRLVDVKLDRFCLELHSNKAQKTDVLKQIQKSWSRVNELHDIDWEAKTQKLSYLRNKLNCVVKHLHKKHRNGLTAHHAIGIKIRDEHAAQSIKLHWPSANHHDQATLNRMRESVRNIRIHAKNTSELSSSSLSLITNFEWTPFWEEKIYNQASELSRLARSTAAECKNMRSVVCSAIDIETHKLPEISPNLLAKLAALLVDSYQHQVSYAIEPGGLEVINAFQEATECLENYTHFYKQLSCPYVPFAWRHIDGNDIDQRWKTANASWWPMRWFKQNRIVKELRAAGANGNPNPGQDAALLAQLRDEGEKIDRLDELLSKFKAWSGHTTDPSIIKELGQLGQRARMVISEITDDFEPQVHANLRSKFAELLHEHNDMLNSEARIGRAATAFRIALNELQLACREFESISLEATTSSPDTKPCILSNYSINQIQEAADSIIQHRGELRDWCTWLKRRSEAINADLLPVIKAIESNRVLADDIETAFEAAYCSWWSKAIIGEDDVLRSFFSLEHKKTIADFQKTDDEFQRITAHYIATQLVKNRPLEIQKFEEEQRFLSREMVKKKKHNPIRQLLNEAPNVIRALTPCFMMSPLSVAQYLPTEHALFDLVIFDEASQITTWDAIGSIARGRQVIVAGDPMQMPPSNFFDRSDDDPSEDVSIEGDLESILDEMRGAGIPEHYLNMHYRSKKESLIAFSNDRYYDNSLVTFPASTTADDGICLVRPKNAFYARGGARTNQGEAKAVVAEVVRLLEDSTSATYKPSIGVVTFNSEQQRLIEDLLDKKRRTNGDIDRGFDPSLTTEPVFIKNLETVQGDERDIILFSTTYGPDRNGHMTLNFGPLNREGGERRLNVALTRARQKMIVFSTLNADEFDIHNTKSRAVKDLKDFLQYAGGGFSSITSTTFASDGDFESPFEMAVAQELKQLGWQVIPQVGVSKYRIDLGIVHRNKPGRFLAGVECDGAMYHSSSYARERDRIRQRALEDREWKLLRIWSTDWWNNKPRQVKTIHDELEKLLEEDSCTEKERPTQ